MDREGYPVMDDGLRSLKTFQSFRNWVLRSADQLVFSIAAGSEAVPLRDLVYGVGITKVVFKPMFASGGLIRRRDEFEMHVDCRKSEVSEWTNRLHDDSDLGVTLPAQTRLTIA